MIKSNRIIFCGKTCAGKTFISEKLKKVGFKLEISYTTRPIRNEETHYKDYIFINEEVFQQKILNGEFYEYIEYNGNYYGTGIKEFYNANVFVWETDGIKKLKPEDRSNTCIIYIDTPEKIRMQRMQDRGWDPVYIHERIQTDELKFKDFKNYDLKIQSID